MSIFSTPGISVCINQNYLPFITGALEVLAIGDYWEDPNSVLPEIEKLLVALNEVAGDCEAPSTVYCASWDFTDTGHEDQWEGQATADSCSSGPVYNSFLNGWELAGCSPPGTNGILCDIHLHLDTPATFTRCAVLYSIVGSGGHDNQSYSVLFAGADRSGTLVYADGGLPLSTDIVHEHSFSAITSADWVVEVQIQNDGGAHSVGDVIIHAVEFSGLGDQPLGSVVCAG